MNEKEKAALIQEGRNQVLYLMLCIGDENVAHDNFHPEVAQPLYEARKEIVQRMKQIREDGVKNTMWPHRRPDGTRDWPDFEKYTYCSG